MDQTGKKRRALEMRVQWLNVDAVRHVFTGQGGFKRKREIFRNGKNRAAEDGWARIFLSCSAPR
jgi:hypothetical protein